LPNFGSLEQVVDFQQAAKDGTFSTVAGWGSLRAAVRPLTSRESNEAGMQAGETAFEIALPYRAGLKPEWTVLWGSRRFHIRGMVNPREQNRWWLITAVEFLDEA